MKPPLRSSRTTTRWPSRRQWSATCEPMKPAPPVTREVVTPVESSMSESIRNAELEIAGVAAEISVEVFHHSSADRKLAAADKAHALDTESVENVSLVVDGEPRPVSRRGSDDPVPAVTGPAGRRVALDRDDRCTATVGSDRPEHLTALGVAFVLADVHVPRRFRPLLLQVRDASVEQLGTNDGHPFRAGIEPAARETDQIAGVVIELQQAVSEIAAAVLAAEYSVHPECFAGRRETQKDRRGLILSIFADAGASEKCLEDSAPWKVSARARPGYVEITRSSEIG